MSVVRAKTPFRFFVRLSLTCITGRKARTLRELLEGIREAADSVIYHHTHRFLQQHQFLVPEPPNDFAWWVTQTLREERVGERLAALDTVRYRSLPDLRQALARTVEEELPHAQADRHCPDGMEFHFLKSVRFSLPTAHLASTLEEFAEALNRVSPLSLYLHIFEARLRPPVGVNDFSAWLEKELGETELARQIDRLDPYTQTLQGLRARILRRIEDRRRAAGGDSSRILP